MTEEDLYKKLPTSVGSNPQVALQLLATLEAWPQKVLDEALSRLAWWGEYYHNKPWTGDHEALLSALRQAGANANPDTKKRLAKIAKREREAKQKAQLLELTRAGDLDGVQALLPKVKRWEKDVREIVLLEAAHRGQTAIVAAQLDAGAQPDAVHGCYTSSDYFTPLHHAAAQRNVEMVKLLLAHGADVNVVQRKTGVTPLHEVLRAGYDEAAHLSLVQMLLDAGAGPNLPRNMVDFNGRGKNEKLRTVLQLAIARGARQTVSLLLEHGADIDRRDTKQQTALTLAVRKIIREKAEDWSLLDWLLELGADLNAANYDFQDTPLTVAAEYNRVDLIDYLVQAGADINRNYALLEATDRGRVDAARRLLELGADPNEIQRSRISPDWTSEKLPLIKAIDKPALVQVLLEYGAQVDIKVRMDYNDTLTPLEYCRAKRFCNHEQVIALLTAALAAKCPEEAAEETVRYLVAEIANAARNPRRSKSLAHWLERGAAPNGRNEYGRTALHYVVERGRSLDNVHLLLDAGASVNTRDPFGYTPLHDSVLGDNAELIQLLLDAGADPAARVERGIHHDHTALEIARIERRENAINLLTPLSPEPRPLTPCEPELRSDGSVKGFSHRYYEDDAAKNELAKAGKSGHHIFLHKAGKVPRWGAKGERRPCVCTSHHEYGAEYRGAGIPRAEHPLRWRMAMDACLHCGSEEVLVTYAAWGVAPHIGDAHWNYAVKCTACGYYSSWGYDDG